MWLKKLDKGTLKLVHTRSNVQGEEEIEGGVRRKEDEEQKENEEEDLDGEKGG